MEFVWHENLPILSHPFFFTRKWWFFGGGFFILQYHQHCKPNLHYHNLSKPDIWLFTLQMRWSPHYEIDCCCHQNFKYLKSWNHFLQGCHRHWLWGCRKWSSLKFSAKTSSPPPPRQKMPASEFASIFILIFTFFMFISWFVVFIAFTHRECNENN